MCTINVILFKLTSISWIFEISSLCSLW